MQETEVIPVKRKRGRPRKIVKESQESQPSPNNVPIPATEAGLLVRPRTRRTLDTTDISRKLEDNEEKIRSQKRSHSQGSSSSEKSQSRNRNASEDSQPATRVTRRSATALNVSISDDDDKHEARNTEENEPGAKRSRRSASKEVVGNLIFTSFENLHEMTSFMDDTDSEKETNRSSSAKPTNENDHTGKTDKHKDDGKPADAPQPIIIPFRVNPQFRTLVRLKSGIQSSQVVKLKRESRNEPLSSMHGKSNQDLPSNSAKETPVIKKASKPPPQADETEDQSSKLTPTPKSNYEVRKTSAVLGALHPPVRSTSKGSAVNKSTQAEMNEMQSSSEKQPENLTLRQSLSRNQERCL
ncbi:Hypothetical predicted protein [Cloeon dipterum]|uniref:Uncharacterized protein n=1 Tax=Cloeon dipterum TaxID=197152 RepID=A0A8S1C2T5_9INSE|nr:Hypothetical predicted protein [Cloeon dipterum]